MSFTATVIPKSRSGTFSILMQNLKKQNIVMMMNVISSAR